MSGLDVTDRPSAVGGRTAVDTLPTAPAGRRRLRPSRVARHVVLLVATVIFGYPLLWLLIGAGKTMPTFFTHLWWFGGHYHWSNFTHAWTAGSVGHFMLNSVIVTVASIALNLLVVYPLAYAVARLRFRGDTVVLGVFAVCLFVPVQLTVIPLFSLEVGLHLLDSYLGLILPYAAAMMPFSVVFVTAYLRTIPRELEEAAMLDGASRLRIMLRIMLPLSTPAFATAVVFGFLHTWNEFLVALTLTHSASVRTLPLGLLTFTESQTQPDYSLVFAALALSIVPIFAVFLVAQRRFLNGLMAGATKL